MIKLQAIGHLGKDALVNNVNGKTVINFSVAHTESWKDSTGEKKTKTTWVNCSYWTDKTGIVPYLNKGTTVYVEGVPEAKPFVTQDGTAKADLHLRVVSVQLLGTGKQEGAPAGPAADNTPAAAPVSDVSSEPVDDLPF